MDQIRHAAALDPCEQYQQPASHGKLVDFRFPDHFLGFSKLFSKLNDFDVFRNPVETVQVRVRIGGKLNVVLHNQCPVLIALRQALPGFELTEIHADLTGGHILEEISSGRIGSLQFFKLCLRQRFPVDGFETLIR